VAMMIRRTLAKPSGHVFADASDTGKLTVVVLVHPTSRSNRQSTTSHCIPVWQ